MEEMTGKTIKKS